MKELHPPLLPAFRQAILPALMIALAWGTPAAQAETYAWLGTSGTGYATTTNWSPDGPPAASGTATFGNSATITEGIYGATNRTAATFIFTATKDYSFIIPRDDRYYLLGTALTQNGSGTVTFNAPLRFGSGAVINGSGSGNIYLNGVLDGDNALRVESTGSFRVLVNGTQSATAGTNQLNTAASSLGGTGRLSRQLAITAAGATVAPGVNGAAGALTLAGGFSSVLATHFEFDLGGTGGAHDQLLITGGTLRLGNPGAGGYSLQLRDLGLGATAIGTPLTLIKTDASVTLDLSSFNPNAFSVSSLPTGWVLDSAYGLNGVLFNPLTGNLSVQFTAVPEPATTSLLLVLSIGGVALARRRKSLA